jgi:hypothetical protein
MAQGAQTVLVESSMVILSSKEFQQFAQRFGGIKRLTQETTSWAPGQAQLIDADIKATTIEFGKPLSLKALKQAVDASPFRYSLDHYRRPGQPIGTSIDMINAKERAQEVATKEEEKEEETATQHPKPQSISKAPYQPFPVDPMESTAMKVNTEKHEIPYAIQQTEEGLFYVDYPDFDPKAQSYKDYRIQGPDRKKVNAAVKSQITRIKHKLSA